MYVYMHIDICAHGGRDSLYRVCSVWMRWQRHDGVKGMQLTPQRDSQALRNGVRAWRQRLSLSSMLCMDAVATP